MLCTECRLLALRLDEKAVRDRVDNPPKADSDVGHFFSRRPIGEGLSLGEPNQSCKIRISDSDTEIVKSKAFSSSSVSFMLQYRTLPAPAPRKIPVLHCF